jgi:L-fucose mutarotase
MLYGIDPLLGPDLLALLRSMGHGDRLVVVDRNFPAYTAGLPVVRVDGADTTAVLRAIVSLMPLDDFVPVAAWSMDPVDAPGTVPATVAEFDAVLAEAPVKTRREAVERFAFYERARDVSAVVQTGERRPYGNIILQKGVIF